MFCMSAKDLASYLEGIRFNRIEVSARPVVGYA